MKRVLCLVSAMDAGGAETFLMKIYRRLDKSEYQMDFCVNEEKEGLYDAEIKSMGGRIFRVPSKSENLKEFARGLYDTVREGGYRNVMRVTSNAMGFYDLYIAKKAGAENCIARSSNSSDGGGLKAAFAHTAGKILFKRYVDVMIAPSDLAAVYTFGKRDCRKGKVNILHNGIDFDEYRFSEDERARIRNELCIPEDCFLIGHVGRFTAQKNHGFLVGVFKEIHEKHKNTRLLLVGEGEKEAEIKNAVNEAGLEGCTVFAGVRKDVPAILSATDAFVFPSLYEGMPNVIIEAQASGLKCLISDTITKQVAVTPLVKQLSIASRSEWIKELDDMICAGGNVPADREGIFLPDEYDIGNVERTFTSYLV